VGLTSTLLTMQIVYLLHTQASATLSLFQVEYETRAQSWLGLTASHLTRGINTNHVPDAEADGEVAYYAEARLLITHCT